MHHPRLHRCVTLGALTLSATLLVGCNSKPITANAPPPNIAQLSAPVPAGDAPENMLDWAGTYQAVLPCSNCPGIAVSVQLRPNKTASVRERRVGSDAAATTTYSGNFRFDPPNGSLITLRQSATEPVAYRFFVGENWIEMRDHRNGNALQPASLYQLKKTSIPS